MFECWLEGVFVNSVGLIDSLVFVVVVFPCCVVLYTRFRVVLFGYLRIVLLVGFCNCLGFAGVVLLC